MNSIPATVLVIEAHPMMREALCSAIADEPDLKIAMQAGDVGEALEMATRIIPDIILLALDQPDGHDMQALTALHKSLPAVPILALTNNEVREQEQAALGAGADAVLTKAAPRQELLATLRALYSEANIDHSKRTLTSERSEREEK